MLPTYSPHPAHMNKHSGSSNHHDVSLKNECDFHYYNYLTIILLISSQRRGNI